MSNLNLYSLDYDVWNNLNVNPLWGSTRGDGGVIPPSYIGGATFGQMIPITYRTDFPGTKYFRVQYDGLVCH